MSREKGRVSARHARPSTTSFSALWALSSGSERTRPCTWGAAMGGDSRQWNSSPATMCVARARRCGPRRLNTWAASVRRRGGAACSRACSVVSINHWRALQRLSMFASRLSPSRRKRRLTSKSASPEESCTTSGVKLWRTKALADMANASTHRARASDGWRNREELEEARGSSLLTQSLMKGAPMSASSKRRSSALSVGFGSTRGAEGEAEEGGGCDG
mmetsp:Transcript_13123/g.31150  ORF Transcript_13123/g.31150 Transcript_13123/m.31150 type:complete len:218 (-) Transcript_13123:36-689(-)